MSYLAQRRKAILALAVSLVGGVLAVFPDEPGLQLLAAVVTAVATSLGVERIRNAPIPDVGLVPDPIAFLDEGTGTLRANDPPPPPPI